MCPFISKHSGRPNRQCKDLSRLLHDRLATQWPHRHSPRRCRQLRTRKRSHRNRGDYAATADCHTGHPAQQQLPQVREAFSNGPLPAEAVDAYDETVRDRGTLKAIENQVDPVTGSVQLKVEFPNSNLRLWPGEFVIVKLFVGTLRQVVVIPSPAQRARLSTLLSRTIERGFEPSRSVTTTRIKPSSRMGCNKASES